MLKSQVLQTDIFDKNIQVAKLQQMSKNTMVEHLGIEFTELGQNYITATMPVDHRTHQPMGLLHGGASLVLAETLGSVASSLLVDLNKFFCVGLEINANHIKSARNGVVKGVARPIHLGKKTHVWDIRISNQNGDLLCISRLTVAIIEKNINKPKAQFAVLSSHLISTGIL
ncbi:MAG: hotdog fold thioesterase [Cyclobacteriaceae bacterium]|nr:hotdog fold thioesterase [Cyclobacteriaceae bacterium]